MTSEQDPVVWQRRTCGAWCKRRHEHTDSPINRLCTYEAAGVPLSMSTAHAGGENQGPHMTEATVGLEQQPREFEAHVVVSPPTEVENLTLDEAEQLAGLLVETVQTAREAAQEVNRW